jgi:hypothetical protein
MEGAKDEQDMGKEGKSMKKRKNFKLKCLRIHFRMVFQASHMNWRLQRIGGVKYEKVSPHTYKSSSKTFHWLWSRPNLLYIMSQIDFNNKNLELVKYFSTLKWKLWEGLRLWFKRFKLATKLFPAKWKILDSKALRHILCDAFFKFACFFVVNSLISIFNSYSELLEDVGE